MSILFNFLIHLLLRSTTLRCDNIVQYNDVPLPEWGFFKIQSLHRKRGINIESAYRLPYKVK